MDNAFWLGGHRLLAFGDGSNNNPLVELDVVSHELTHGVTQFEANLQYYNEFGALNESFSDILGKAVEFDVFGDTATWQLAKHFRPGGLRDFSNPNLQGQPDTYAGILWYTGSDDSGGVHYNSGVQNFWYYLLCEGGNGVNDHNFEYAVDAIGMEQATQIAYRNLTEYLGPFSEYLDSRIGSMLATADLYGKNSPVYQQVDNAWDAVGVIDEPIITSLEVFDVTATTAKLRGSMQPRGDTATYHFEYGTTLAFGNSTAPVGYADKVEGRLTGLQSQTKYYLRLAATNDYGSSYSAPVTFTTLTLAPIVEIRPTVDITETSAVVYGKINPNSLPTTFYFEYGLTPALGSVTSSSGVPGATEFINVSADIADLQPRQTYYYRLVADNGFSTAATGLSSLFTSVKPHISSISPSAGPINSEVTILGSNFNTLPENNWVSFGATRATVLSSTTTEIKVKVPAGASYGAITLLDGQSGRAAESAQEFVPTYTGEFGLGSLQLRAGINDPYVWNALVQDMDGDKKPDIVTVHSQGLTIFQNVNQGGDITSESFYKNSYPVSGTSSDFFVADLDANGMKDIVWRYGDGLRIFPNFSVPGFVFFGPLVELPMQHLANLTLRDFDVDGHIDIAGTRSVSYNSSEVVIYRNKTSKGSALSTGNFDEQFAILVQHNIEFMTSGDLNNDGKPDLLFGSNYIDSLSVLSNNGSPGEFEFEETIIPDTARQDRFARYLSHDLNRDGWKDVIYHSRHIPANVTIRQNTSTLSGIALGVPEIVLSEREATDVQAADLDGDGKVDLLAALDSREFIVLKNQTETGAQLSKASLQKFAELGMDLENTGTVDSRMVVNDLNGDGRPEVINVHQYYFGPHDGYQMEIWQNSPGNCLDPSLIKVNAASATASIALPPNTTMADFEIEYAPADADYWWQVYENSLYWLSPGTSYKFRARAHCYLAYTAYHELTFTTDCVDVSSYSINTIGVDHVYFNADDFTVIEAEYSLAGKEEWQVIPFYPSEILNLLPGTAYDLRFRGRCPVSDFKYMQFVTLCPSLASLTMTELSHDKVAVTWATPYSGDVTVEYSQDEINWIPVSDNTIFPLVPGKEYFSRAHLSCTDANSDFIFKSFSTSCPKVSMLHVDQVTPFGGQVTWVDESETGSYILSYHMLDADNGKTTVQTNSTSFQVDDLTPGRRYQVAVAPECLAEEKFSAVSFTTNCYLPSNVSVDEVTYTTAQLSWSDHLREVPYTVEYSIVGTNVWHTLQNGSANLLLIELRPGTSYEARVHINCPAGSAFVYVQFQTPIHEETTYAPNPTNSEITIYPSQSLVGKHFSIHDNAGKEIIGGVLIDYSIDLSGLSAGIYLLKIEGEKLVKITKH
jgi:hypothetical protein